MAKDQKPEYLVFIEQLAYKGGDCLESDFDGFVVVECKSGLAKKLTPVNIKIDELEGFFRKNNITRVSTCPVPEEGVAGIRPTVDYDKEHELIYRQVIEEPDHEGYREFFRGIGVELGYQDKVPLARR